MTVDYERNRLRKLAGLPTEVPDNDPILAKLEAKKTHIQQLATDLIDHPNTPNPTIIINAGHVEVETDHGPVFVDRELSEREVELINMLDPADVAVIQRLEYDPGCNWVDLYLFKQVYFSK